MEESKNLSRFDDEGEKIDAAKLTPKEAEAITLDLLHQIKEQQQKKGFSLSEFSLQAKSVKKAEASMAASIKPMASLSNKKDKPERAQSLTAFEPANASRGSSAPTARLLVTVDDTISAEQPSLRH